MRLAAPTATAPVHVDDGIGPDGARRGAGGAVAQDRRGGGVGPGDRVHHQSAPETPVPVASLTKLMTAYIVLRDHPLPLGQQGPKLTITPADVADWNIVVSPVSPTSRWRSASS